jgi:HEAT repeat protein
MRGKQYQSQGIIFLVLTLLSGIISPFIVTNIETIAQTPSTQMQCSEVEIKKYIQQLDSGETSNFDALVECRSQSVPALIDALNNPDENIRIIAIAALGEIGIPAASAVPALKTALTDKSVEVRLITVDALGKIRKRAVPSLITALEDRDEEVRQAATNALVKIGKPALPGLIKALETGSWQSRLYAAVVLGQMQSNAKQAIPAMIRTFGKSLVEESEVCPYSFYFALKDINTDIIPELNAALKDKDWKVRVGAIALFGEVTSYSNAIPTLTRVILNENEDIRVRYIAVISLSNLKSEQATSVIKKYQKTVDLIVQKAKASNFQFPSTLVFPTCMKTVVGTLSVGKATANASSKPRPMCKIPAIRALLWWKCPKYNYYF